MRLKSFAQLFEKLKLQESSGGDEPAKQRKAQGKTDKHQPANPNMTPKSLSAQRQGGDSRTEPKLSESAKTKQGKHEISLKAQDPETCQKKDSQAHGKVHTRHINQLFIRGENVILVNPQPL